MGNAKGEGYREGLKEGVGNNALTSCPLSLLGVSHLLCPKSTGQIGFSVVIITGWQAERLQTLVVEKNAASQHFPCNEKYFHNAAKDCKILRNTLSAA